MDGDTGERWGRGVGRGHGYAPEHSVMTTGSEIGQGRGRGRGQVQGTSDLGQVWRDVDRGAGLSSRTVHLAASHTNTSAVRARMPRSLPLPSQQDVDRGAGPSSTTVRLAASHNNTSAVRAPRISRSLPFPSQQDVDRGAGPSSTTVRLAASHNNTSAVRTPRIPRSPPLLSQQEGHKSTAVLSGHILKELTVRKHKITIPWCRQIRDYVVNAGFYGLHQIGYVRSDKFLISALVERWRPETHSFHLPVGEMMVTLQDVGVLLGLPINGEPICLPKVEHNWSAVIKDYLGREVDDQTFYDESRTAIRITWLKREFKQPLDAGAPEHEVQCYARAYILLILGSLLFTDVSGGWISAKYLYFLTDLNKTGKYSWGSAVLAYLNKELCRVCRKKSRQMAGPILLLQFWAWERFLFGRPKVRHDVPKPRLGGPVVECRPPYGYLWSGYHDWTENPARVLSYYRDELDHLREYQVNWEPYKEQRLAFLPPICTSARARDLWMYTGPVIHFETVEPHNPSRVMRQFGKHQEVPPNPSRIFNGYPCSYQDKQKKLVLPNWKPNHEEDIKKWRQRFRTILRENREYDPSTYEEYKTWYSANTILYLQPAKAIGPLSCDPRSLQYQIRAGNTHKAAEKIKELKKIAAKKMAESVHEATRVLAQQMITGLKDVLDILGEYDDAKRQLPTQRRVHVPQRQQEQQRNVGSSSGGVECPRSKRPRVG